ncbi:MAG: hypothetical protein JSW52_01115 [Candidatus Coatesbacteria bacterium]|nr:MAG: hypothetical protein JSW52_01115 [Candidatus Coatesbacteria bacterium]
MKITFVIVFLIAVNAGWSVWLTHCDGTSYTHVAHTEAGDGWGVRFDPPFECGWIETVEFYVHQEPDDEWDSFTMWLCEYRPGADIPGDVINDFGEVTYDIIGDEGWASFSTGYFWGNMDSFVIALIQPRDSPNCNSLAVDVEQTDPNPNFNYFDGYWVPFILKDGDFLMRVDFVEYESIEPESLGNIKALYR